jgi:hypothetical protein
MKFFFLAASLGLFMLCYSGCNNISGLHNKIISKYPASFEYVKFKNGKEVSKTYIKKGDKIYDDLFNWISVQNNKWKRDYLTYAPQNIFCSDQLNINVINGIVIINFQVKGNKWIQITRKVTESQVPSLISYE